MTGSEPVDAVLDVVGLSIHYGGVAAVSDVSTRVGRGTITGLIGPNGAGKTSFIDAVCGFTPTHAGRITFDGRPFDRLGPSVRARRGLVRTFQSLELFDDLSVRENLLVAAHTPTIWSTITDALWHKKHPSAEADAALASVGLEAVADALPSQLSNGQRHLVAIARALAGSPTLLLLDEPAAGLDPTETVALAATIRSIRDGGVTVLLVDHDMSLVLDVCDTVRVLDQGRLIASGPPAEIRRDPVVLEAYLGQEAAP